MVEGHADLAPALADSWALRAVALLKLGDPAAARIWVERALELYRKIIEDQGRDDLAGKLARLRELAAIIGSPSPRP